MMLCAFHDMKNWSHFISST